jgi:hypothetical protein
MKDKSEPDYILQEVLSISGSDNPWSVRTAKSISRSSRSKVFQSFDIRYSLRGVFSTRRILYEAYSPRGVFSTRRRLSEPEALFDLPAVQDYGRRVFEIRGFLLTLVKAPYPRCPATQVMGNAQPGWAGTAYRSFYGPREILQSNK